MKNVFPASVLLLLLPAILFSPLFFSCQEKETPEENQTAGLSKTEESPQREKSEAPLTIAFFNPDDENDPWWNIATELLQEACRQLDMELEVHYAARSRGAMVKQLEETIQDGTIPDAIIFQSLKQNGPFMLDLAEAETIPAFIVNAGLVGEAEEEYGRPREKYRYWVGQMLPDDESAGYWLARYLITQAEEKGIAPSNSLIRILRIDGNPTDFAAIERKKGFERAVAENSRAHLQKAVSAQWERDQAREMIPHLLKKYPETDVIWAANDQMGFGILDGLIEEGMTPGEDLLVGSIDWLPEAAANIRAGLLEASVGGHFFEPVWAAILLHDYLKGADFADQGTDLRSAMKPLSAENIDTFIDLSRDNWADVDFTRYSRVLNKDWTGYQFAVEEILR